MIDLRTQFTRPVRPARPPSGRRRAGPLAGLHSRRARPLRFILVGGVCSALQLALLWLLTHAGMHPIAANIAAYLGSAQVNFYLSDVFIWGDRRGARLTFRDLLRRWLAFHASIAGTFVLNQVTFILARTVLPDILASALGIGLSAIVNFAVQDRLAFRPTR